MFTAIPRPERTMPPALLDHHPLLDYLFFFDTSLDTQCAGYDYTHSRPRRCNAITSEQDQAEAIRLLTKAAADFHSGRMERIGSTLAELAPHVLCPRVSHQAQAPGLVARWTRDAEMFMAGYGAMSELRARDPFADTSRIVGGADADATTSTNETWRERVFRGVWEILDRVRWTHRQLVPRLPRFTSPEQSRDEHEQMPVSDFNWDYSPEYAYENGNGHEHDYSYEHESESASNARATTVRTSTESDPEPSHTPAVPWDIPAEPTLRLRDSQWGLPPSPPRASALVNPPSPQRDTASKPNTVYALRHPIDGDCSICFTSLLEHPYDTDSDSDADAPSTGRDMATDTGTGTDAESEQLAISLSPPHSIHRWYDTDTGEWGYTDATGEQFAFHALSSRPHEVKNTQDALSAKPLVPELSWCQTGCGVNYHKQCIDRWTALAPLATCPTCRRAWVGQGLGRTHTHTHAHTHGSGYGHGNRPRHRAISYSFPSPPWQGW
ncbi:uncharacterized protein DSM5745_02390 [Aspergillus mulundensis]|uniref:RING-type domain-containing protein n=1 Tax=Aspergillus mulundensis TaxID=1810919 RepID=A0A3D8SWD7_9EURO|nr:hypothetical protein DSM5745_02390 [Aspergillus mulundensis]RDW90615.1 hypothetical protein DSM5745_02390 [Aspergillus mulundensis]